MSGLPAAATIRGPFLRLVADRMAALHRRRSVAFFLLDTNPGADWAEQQPWLEQALASSDAPWKVVVGHHPIYSAGRSGNNGPAITRLTPLFRRHGVQLYISCHEHHDERAPIRTPPRPAASISSRRSAWKTITCASRPGITTVSRSMTPP